ncbi:hypothetical protein TNCV_4540141 [Trichonephila clavipes]|nr:hypothetical protein TNCV_4540141 [Trichonephila clavipes]
MTWVVKRENSTERIDDATALKRVVFVEDDSKVFYGSGPWNRVVLDVDWRWFSCVASCGEEDCFSFRWVYGDFPFIVPVL